MGLGMQLIENSSKFSHILIVLAFQLDKYGKGPAKILDGLTGFVQSSLNHSEIVEVGKEASLVNTTITLHSFESLAVKTLCLEIFALLFKSFS